MGWPDAYGDMGLEVDTAGRRHIGAEAIPAIGIGELDHGTTHDVETLTAERTRISADLVVSRSSPEPSAYAKDRNTSAQDSIALGAPLEKRCLAPGRDAAMLAGKAERV